MSALADIHARVDRHPDEGVPPAPVHAHQRTWEFERLLELYRERQPGRILEVGSYEGGTLWHWLRNAEPGAVIVSIDNDAMGGPDLRADWQEWAPPGVTLHELRGDSRSPKIAAAARALGPFDWIFIDADHSYDAVSADWRTYSSMTAAGAIVAFHDILPPSPEHPEIEVSRLWRQLQAHGQLTREIVADANAPWGGIGVVYIEEVPA